VQDSEGFIVVPWNVVTVNYEQKSVIVQSSTVTLDKLREVRFTEGRLPNFSDPTFSQKVTSVWGTGKGRPGPGATRPGDRSGTTTPDKKEPGTTTPDRKGGTTLPPTEKPGTTTPRPKDEPPTKDIPPKKEPKKDKDKDGR
jgi:hypothetical protein